MYVTTDAFRVIGRGRSQMGYDFVWLAGTQPCWLTLSGYVVPLSVHNNVPYLEDPSKSFDSIEALASVGLSRDHGKCEFP